MQQSEAERARNGFVDAISEAEGASKALDDSGPAELPAARFPEGRARRRGRTAHGVGRRRNVRPGPCAKSRSGPNAQGVFSAPGKRSSGSATCSSRHGATSDRLGVPGADRGEPCHGTGIGGPRRCGEGDCAAAKPHRGQFGAHACGRMPGKRGFPSPVRRSRAATPSHWRTAPRSRCRASPPCASSCRTQRRTTTSKPSFAEALAAEADLLARCEVRTLTEARDRARQRQADENAAKLAAQMLRSLAPSGVEALDQALADARETIKDVSKRRCAPPNRLPGARSRRDPGSRAPRSPARRDRGGGRCAGKGGDLRRGPRRGARPQGRAEAHAGAADARADAAERACPRRASGR